MISPNTMERPARGMRERAGNAGKERTGGWREGRKIQLACWADGLDVSGGRNGGRPENRPKGKEGPRRVGMVVSGRDL